MLIGLKNQNRHGIGLVSCNRRRRWISVNIIVLIFGRHQCLGFSAYARSVIRFIRTRIALRQSIHLRGGTRSHTRHTETALSAAAVRKDHRSAVLRHIHFAGRSVCDTPNTAENCISELSSHLCRYGGYSRGITVHMKR